MFTLAISCLTTSNLPCQGNGNPLQYSGLENPRDGGAWWAAVYGVAQSQTWLKWLSSNSPWFVDLTFQVPMQYCSYSIGPFFHHQSHPHLGVVFTLVLSLHSFWSYFSTDLQQHIGHLPNWEVHLFSFPYCSWGSQGKNTEVVCIPFSSGAHFAKWTWVWANLGDSEGQESLPCFSPWGHKEPDTI